jgi:hypothetical protein
MDAGKSPCPLPTSLSTTLVSCSRRSGPEAIRRPLWRCAGINGVAWRLLRGEQWRRRRLWCREDTQEVGKRNASWLPLVSSRIDPHGVDCIYAQDHPGEHRDAGDKVYNDCRQFAMLAFLASNAVSSIAVLDAAGRAKKHGQLDVQQEYRENFLRHERRNPEAEYEDFAPARRESGNGDHLDRVERWTSRRVQLWFVEKKKMRGDSQAAMKTDPDRVSVTRVAGASIAC